MWTSDYLLKLLMVVAFFAVMIGVGVYCRRHAKNVDAFVLGNRKVGPWLTAFAYGTSYFSAVIFVGYAGQFGWKYGLSATWIGIGNALIGSLLVWLVVGRRTRVMTRHLGSTTMPDFFEKRYGVPRLRTAASVLIFIFLIPYTASLYNGLSRLFEMAFDIDYAWCVAIMAALTCVYVLAGGYMATAINDLIQGVIMLAGIVAVVAATLQLKGGFAQAFESLGGVGNGEFVSLFGPAPLQLLGVVVLTSLGSWGMPQMIGKFYAIKDESAIRRGTVISTVFALVVAGGCYFLGSFGRIFTDDAAVARDGFDSIIPGILSGLAPALVGLVILLVLSASMSTLAALVMTSGSTLTLDVIAPAQKQPMSDRRKLLLIRGLIAVFILLSAVIAIVQARSRSVFIAQLMGVSWGALAGSFLAPFLYGLYSRRVTPAAVWTSFGSGVLIMTSCFLCNLLGVRFESPVLAYFSSPINAGMLAMVLGLVLVPVVSYFTKQLSLEDTDRIFACYDKD
ncbi:MAG: sodium:solute symporter [Eubacteriales bacterium]